MTPARLRELSAAINPPDRLAVLIGAVPVSPEPVTTETVGDALTWAASEIERLEKDLAAHREYISIRDGHDPTIASDGKVRP